MSHLAFICLFFSGDYYIHLFVLKWFYLDERLFITLYGVNTHNVWFVKYFLPLATLSIVNILYFDCRSFWWFRFVVYFTNSFLASSLMSMISICHGIFIYLLPQFAALKMNDYFSFEYFGCVWYHNISYFNIRI